MLPGQDHITACELKLRSFRCSSLQAFHFDDPVADVQVALRIWNLDPGCGQMFVDQVIQVAFEAAGLVAHLLGPGDKLEVDGAIAKFLQISRRLRVA